jgi:c-di-GMP-binding flagellar brake protein YcgR
MPHHSTKPAPVRQPTAEERRRSQRVLVRMPVIIHVVGKAPLPGNTHTVSAGGAMVILKEGLSEGTKVIVENPTTKVKAEAKVVRPPQMNQEGSLVPVEFLTPSPTFWNIFFPPFTN